MDIRGRWTQCWRIGLAPFAQLQFFGVSRSIGVHWDRFCTNCVSVTRSDTRHLLKQAANRCPPAALLKPECTSWTVFPMHFEPMVLAVSRKHCPPLTRQMARCFSTTSFIFCWTTSGGPMIGSKRTRTKELQWKPHGSPHIAWAKRSAASLT